MNRTNRWIAALAAGAVWLGAGPGPCAAEKKDEPAKPAGEDREAEARRQLARAKDLLDASDADRAVKSLEALLEQYPASKVRFEALLLLGRYYTGKDQSPKGLTYLLQMKAMAKGEEAFSKDEKDVYVEGLYWTGIAYFNQSEHANALPILRKLTNDYPNTIWANQAYYYIGMCHYKQGNWSKAIEALNLVGTSIDPESPTVEYVEAGWRFYVKVQDGDLPVLQRLGKDVKVTLQTKSGDKETVPCSPLAASGDVFIGSIATRIGPPKAGDDTLEVIGGDEITVQYLDENTQEGKKNETRGAKVKVVSTATLAFTLGTFESKVPAAYLDQPLFVLLGDLDKDVSEKADQVQVKLVSRYVEAEEEEDAATPDKAPAKGKKKPAPEPDPMDFDKPEKKYKIRDEATVTLTESDLHSGRFGGSVKIVPAVEGQAVSKADGNLTCAVDDEIIATYVDELHINGQAPRDVTAAIKVVGEIESRPRAVQYLVFDPSTKARKCVYEATAYLELGRIFKSMGLMKGAGEKCVRGLQQVDEVIKLKEPIPNDVKESAFKVKWELYLLKEDYPNAIATCRLFNKIFPQSPLVDQALLSIGAVNMESKKFDQAIQVYSEIIALPNSQAKAEAQFHLAEAIEQHPYRNKEQAIAQYKLCAEKYPDTPYAGQALGKLVDHYMAEKDYGQANSLLERVFEDYPDADFLDTMLDRWFRMAYMTGDYKKAYEKCSKLVSDYPSSKHADAARRSLPAIEAKLKKE